MTGTNRPIWWEGQRLVLPELAADVHADACVIGLGGSGLSCIHSFCDAGLRVVGVDAAHVAAGAAGRNGGFLLGGIAMFHHDAVVRLGRDTATALYRATLSEIDRMAAETPLAVRRTGSLRIAVSDEESADCEQQLDAMRADGLPVEPYVGREGRGLRFPADAAFDPVARCVARARAALDRGARLFGGSRVRGVDQGVVTTEHARIHAPRIVAAVDGNLETLLPELSSRVRTARLQMLATAPLPRLEFPMPVYARYGLDYWQQRTDLSVVLGGCRDVGGDSEWTTSDEPTETVQAALTALLRSIGVEAPVTHRWAATVAYTQTGLPVIDQVRPSVWAVGGYSGTGNVVGSLAGRAAAEVAVSGSSALADLFRG